MIVVSFILYSIEYILSSWDFDWTSKEWICSTWISCQKWFLVFPFRVIVSIFVFVHKRIVAFCNIGTFGDVGSFRWLSMGRCVCVYVDEEYHRGWRRWIWRIHTDKIWKSDLSGDTLWLFLHSWWQTKSQRSLDFFCIVFLWHCSQMF